MQQEKKTTGTHTAICIVSESSTALNELYYEHSDASGLHVLLSSWCLKLCTGVACLFLILVQVQTIKYSQIPLQCKSERKNSSIHFKEVIQSRNEVITHSPKR